MSVRIPTQADYDAYAGGHCAGIWRSLPEDWLCPGCNRTCFELLRWTLRNKGEPNAYWGWMFALFRYNGTVLCDHCRHAIVSAQRKAHIDRDFLFAGDEIRQFVTSQPHGSHLAVDHEKASEIYVTRQGVRNQLPNPLLEVPTNIRLRQSLLPTVRRH
jgi:predicted Fe-S protein YdhL (DUF1289 family)